LGVKSKLPSEAKRDEAALAFLAEANVFALFLDQSLYAKMV
jgi:hypothetical protein